MKKIINRVNGGFAIYIGIASIIFAVGGLVAMVFGLYKIISGQVEINWWIFIFLASITGILGLIGYVLLRIGYEEIEK